MRCFALPRLILIALLGAACASAAPDFGDAPPMGPAARDLAAAHRLPPWRESRDPVLAAQLSGLQVGVRARALGLTPDSATRVWVESSATLRAARERLSVPLPASVHTFSGTTASRLNAVLADRSITAVRVTTPVLRVDVPVTIGRSNLRLEL